MKPVFETNWVKAYGSSILVHAAVIGLAALVLSWRPAPVGGAGRLTVEIGGQYGGQAGGFGIKQADGQKGNRGNAGDGRKPVAENPAPTPRETPPEKEAPPQEGAALQQPVEPPKAPVAKPEPVKKAVPAKTPEPDRAKAPAPKAPPVKPKTPVKPVQKVVKKPVDKAKPATPVKRDTHGKTDGKATKMTAAGGTGATGSQGSARGTAPRVGSGQGQGKSDGVGDGQFRDNGDGTYTATGGGGVKFVILHDANPRYPKAARSIGYSSRVKVRVRFLVGKDGRVQKVQILNKRLPDLGFREETLKAVRQMEFEPIIYRGEPISVVFKKTVVFVP